MGPRHFGELLMRPPHLKSLALPRRTPTAGRCLAQRSFTLSAAHAQGKPDPERPEHPEHANKPSAPRAPARDDDTSSAIDSLFRSSGFTPQARSSAAEFGAAAAQRPGPFGARFSRPANNFRPRGLNTDEMDLPDELPDSPSQVPVIAEKDIVYPRLNASTGRTVELDSARGRDIVRGLGMLGSLMARNKVKRDFNKQKFHERPGLKRKRLKTERWRANFKIGFEATCARVTELTRKGW